jgi:hypothetical protein
VYISKKGVLALGDEHDICLRLNLIR